MKNSLKEKIAEQLKRAKMEHEFIVLPEDLPSDSLSHVRYLGIAIKEAVPTILYRTEKGLIAAQRCMDSMIDEEKLKKLAGAKQLTFATKKDLEELGLESGYVPLAGLNVPYYTDRRVLELKKAYGGSGSKVFNLKISPHDLVKINQAILGEFTKIATEVSMKVDSKIQVYSGTRATGRLHLGNYLGAVKGYIELQQKYSCVYSVVDLHAITTPYDKDRLSQNTLNVVMDYLSAGLNPEKSFIEVQSLVPQHMELAYYLGTLYPVARLEDLPTYKEKKAQFPKYVNIGLLYYPVLMAADILLYKASLIPVGIDQEPHLEVTREIARNFNREYGLTFPEARRFATPGQYIPSLIDKGKMSKTKEGSYINLVDDLQTIRNRLAHVPTDGGTGKLRNERTEKSLPNLDEINSYNAKQTPESFGVATLFELVELFQGLQKRLEYQDQYKSVGVRYKDLKEQLALAIFKELKPIQEKRKKLEENPGQVKEMLFEHAKKLRKLAQGTIDEVKEKMGFLR